MPYINPNILQEDWAALGDWTDGDTNGAVSDVVDGELYLDCRAMSANGIAKRSQDIGTIGTGDYYVEIRFKGDVWDGYGNNAWGVLNIISAETKRLYVAIGNGFVSPAGDGIIIWGSGGLLKVLTKTWDNDWHTVVLFIHNSQTDCDIWVDKSPSEAADETDVDCDFATDTDGLVRVEGRGTVAGNGEYHIDYLYIGTGLAAAGPANVKSVNGVATASVKSINGVPIASVKSVNGIT